MAEPLVETKLLLPRPRRETVARPRLATLLDRASSAPVTVVSAPAGFGKTTLVSTWLNTWLENRVSGRSHGGLNDGVAPEESRSAAWVSLDDRDRSAASFWTYTLHALDRAVPGCAAASLTLMRTRQASMDAVLAGVVNELSVYPGEVTLVLDDYHLADGPDIAEAMTFLVDHLPPPLRLVISTRADPALPLPRLRVRGELEEIRAADLRFTVEEAMGYLNDLHGLGLGDHDIAALEARTEGWAAALQLAALSLRGRSDASAFIAGFAGDDRYVVDYLADEVLGHQPDDVRRFLLETSILDRLTGPLCDAVSPAPETPGRDGRATLDLLERRNLFLIPLDDHRRVYRYHHLFADVLHTHLLQERPSDVLDLHRRASRWYAENGQPEDAVRHALAAGEVDRAADIVELAIPDLRRDRRESVILHWIEELPADVVDHRPVLAIGFIGALMAGNDFEAVPPRLRGLEELRRAPDSELVVADRAELTRLPAALETHWAALALVGGDTAQTITRAERAIELAADGDDLTTSAAAAVMGLAFWATGHVTAAHRAYTACADGLTRAGHIADVLGCSLTLADLELTLGRLGDAERTLHRALDLAQRHQTAGSPGHSSGHHSAASTETSDAGPVVMRGTADMLVALSRVAWHRNDLVATADYLRRADDLGEEAGLPQHPYRWRVAMARLSAAKRDWSTALDLLDEAQRVYVGDFAPPVHPIHATRARVLTASGDLAAAVAWAEEQAPDPDELSYLHEYEHLTLARIWLAQHQNGQHRADGSNVAGLVAKAVGLLDRLLEAAEASGRVGTVIEIEVLRARTLHIAGEPDEALAALEHAVRLAQPEGWMRFLVDAGPSTSELLHVLAAREPASNFVLDLLAATVTTDIDRRSGRSPAPVHTISAASADLDALAGPPASLRGEEGSGVPGEPVHDRLIDPLSDREIEVLRLLASELDGPGIARELVVSLNTVRTHTKHIYAKLGVNSRRAAMTRAHQLGLLTRSGTS